MHIINQIRVRKQTYLDTHDAPRYRLRLKFAADIYRLVCERLMVIVEGDD